MVWNVGLRIVYVLVVEGGGDSVTEGGVPLGGGDKSKKGGTDL